MHFGAVVIEEGVLTSGVVVDGHSAAGRTNRFGVLGDARTRMFLIAFGLMNLSFLAGVP